ncbi:class I SAM-dependent methyltransferase [Flavisericum labens]|uniref:class I SAM-dependent methyltransferase n=1 Tax=Flavisericum labens TaxID=3377112 RepID=UPI00387B6223
MSKGDNLIDYYWKRNFNDKSVVGVSNDLQRNIARTKSGEVVSKAIWNKTLNYIVNKLTINKESSILELCCGNGLILGELAPLCKYAVGVDYSSLLLSQFAEVFKSDNLNLINQDVLDYKIAETTYNSIILYFSVQHFNERDTFLLISKCIKALKKKGVMLIGDVPDLDKKWHYINKPEYQIDYFKRVVDFTPKIGYWFQKDFFKAMNSCFPDTIFEIIEQPDYQINSDHCFDVLIKKK